MMATIGENIRMLRKIRKLTQKELGELCGIDEANIRKYELNNQIPRVETIKKIADALDVSTFTLLDDVFLQDEATSLPIGGNMKKVRKSKGLTQKELAELMGVSLKTIERYERGLIQPRIDVVKKLSETLSIPISLLIYPPDVESVDLSFIPTKDLLAEIERRCQ